MKTDSIYDRCKSPSFYTCSITFTNIYKSVLIVSVILILVCVRGVLYMLTEQVSFNQRKSSLNLVICFKIMVLNGNLEKKI